MKSNNFKGGMAFKKWPGYLKSDKSEKISVKRAYLPLRQGFSDLLDTDLKIGDEVKAGQIIARNDNSISSPVHSPYDGVIVDIDYDSKIPLIEIEKKGEGVAEKLNGFSEDIDSLSVEKIEELLYLSGVCALDNQGIPTSYKSSVINPQDVENIILHNDPGEIYRIPTSSLLDDENLIKVENGIKILSRLMPNASITYASCEKEDASEKKITQLSVSENNFTVKGISPKYPASFDEVLCSSILGVKFPYGLSPANIGVVIFKLQTLFHISDAVTKGIPLTKKKIALCGTGFKENHFVEVDIGIPLKDIIHDKVLSFPVRLIINDVLYGQCTPDYSLPVDKTFDKIILIKKGNERRFLSFIFSMLDFTKKVSANIWGEKRPCIQCGYCMDVCPVSMVPAHTYRLMKSKLMEDTLKSGILNCINCNLCSYVCPSKIPLAKTFKGGCTILKDKGLDHFAIDYSEYSLKGVEEYKKLKELTINTGSATCYDIFDS